MRCFLNLLQEAAFLSRLKFSTSPDEGCMWDVGCGMSGAGEEGLGMNSAR